LNPQPRLRCKRKKDNVTTPMSSESGSLSLSVRRAVEDYLLRLDGIEPVELYDLVLREVEKPLLQCVLEHSKGNQSRAADLLGLSRTTLRKKLREYDLLNSNEASD
jgi:Fis family transcriptional regulator